VMIILHRGVDCGSSHGVGHMLGPIGHVNQGKTPCILLSDLCKFNAPHSGPEILERQSVIRETLWDMREASIVSEQRNSVAQGADLSDLIDAIAKELG
jgi:alcohol dehydrogenase class IV